MDRENAGKQGLLGFRHGDCHRCLRDLIRFPFCTEGPRLLPVVSGKRHIGGYMCTYPRIFFFGGAACANSVGLAPRRYFCIAQRMYLRR